MVRVGVNAVFCNTKGQVIRETFSFNLSWNILALQGEKRCCSYYHRVLNNFPRNKFQCCKLQIFVSRNFVALQVERAVVRITTTFSTCHAKKFSVPS